MVRKYFKFLSDEEMQKIHETSLRILENVGMLIDHKGALQILHDAGANVDHQSKRVKFTRDLVDKCLKRVPRTVIYGGRHPEDDMVLKTGGELYARGNSGQTSYVDLQTGEYRPGKLEDVKQWAILIDALPNINGVGPLHPGDVPTMTADIHSFRILLENQRKHISNQAFSVRNLKYQLEMVVAVQGSREEVKKRSLFHNFVVVVSPLYVSEENVDMLMLAGEYGIPSGFVSMINVAATGPATLAGTLALGNAEMLGAACLTNILCPGKPQTYLLEPGVTEMSNGALMLGSAENVILCSALSQLANSLYQIPVETAAMASDWTITEEAALQKATNGLMAAYHGASFIFGCGSIDTFMAQSPIQLVIDDEIVGMIRRIIRGLEVDEDRLGLAAVERVGPQGTFITDPHTRKYMRGEYFQPKLFNRDPRTVWLSKGSKNLEQRAREKALRILQEHKVEPLDSHVLKELDLLAKKADQELAK